MSKEVTAGERGLPEGPGPRGGGDRVGGGGRFPFRLDHPLFGAGSGQGDDRQHAHDAPEEIESDDEIVDAIGEVTNMIAGNIKTHLFKKIPLFDISTPSVTMGQEVKSHVRCQSAVLPGPLPVGGDGVPGGSSSSFPSDQGEKRGREREQSSLFEETSQPA